LAKPAGFRLVSVRNGSIDLPLDGEILLVGVDLRRDRLSCLVERLLRHRTSARQREARLA
jgi:hypothetical protein